MFVSAAIVATLITEVEGDPPITIAPDIPVFWIPQAALIRVTGEASCAPVIQRLGFSLLSISPAVWNEERLLTTISLAFSEAELSVADSSAQG
ncbi:MAG: hypothetical protein PSU94_06835 [Lacunisphaera sp.]|nr:hypothetical protein [Lacunisphaera sp.]